VARDWNFDTAVSLQVMNSRSAGTPRWGWAISRQIADPFSRRQGLDLSTLYTMITSARVSTNLCSLLTRSGCNTLTRPHSGGNR